MTDPTSNSSHTPVLAIKRYDISAHKIEEAEKVSKEIKTAVAYLRTSSRANVGADKDSDKRQRAAIQAYEKAAGIETRRRAL